MENKPLLLYQTQTDENVSAEILFIIDEIKVIRQDMEKLDSAAQVHVAQALCYAYMYARVLNTKAAGVTEENEEKKRLCIGIQITYCHPETEEIKRFLKVYTFKEIKEEFDYYISEYGKWAQFLYEHRLERNASVQKLSFPYPYRAGQKLHCCGSIPHDDKWRTAFYSGTDRDRKDTFDCISSCMGSWRGVR